MGKISKFNIGQIVISTLNPNESYTIIEISKNKLKVRARDSKLIFNLEKHLFKVENV